MPTETTEWERRGGAEEEAAAGLYCVRMVPAVFWSRDPSVGCCCVIVALFVNTTSDRAQDSHQARLALVLRFLCRVLGLLCQRDDVGQKL